MMGHRAAIPGTSFYFHFFFFPQPCHKGSWGIFDEKKEEAAETMHKRWKKRTDLCAINISGETQQPAEKHETDSGHLISLYSHQGFLCIHVDMRMWILWDVWLLFLFLIGLVFYVYFSEIYLMLLFKKIFGQRLLLFIVISVFLWPVWWMPTCKLKMGE